MRLLIALTFAVVASAQWLPFPGMSTGSQPYSILQQGGFTASTVGAATSNLKRAQSFVPAFSMHVTSIKVKIAKVGSPGDNVVVELWTSAGSGTNAKPSVLISASTPFAGASLTTTMTDTPFAFSSVPLSASTKYWIVVSRSGAVDASHYYTWTYSAGGDLYPGGGLETYTVSSWSSESTAADLVFTVAGVTP